MTAATTTYAGDGHYRYTTTPPLWPSSSECDVTEHLDLFERNPGEAKPTVNHIGYALVGACQTE
jgi:hypothetical protein